MTLNFYTLGVLYLVYSFLGWVGETVVATFRGKRFANRGMAAGPFCFVYGTTAILMAVGFADLHTKPVVLFVACMLTATVVEWLTAKLLERLHNRKWWDYSDKKFNLNGYVCLQYSVLWGALGMVTVLWGNGLLLRLCALVPDWLLHPLVWVALGIAALDQLGSAVLVEAARQQPTAVQKGESRLPQRGRPAVAVCHRGVSGRHGGDRVLPSDRRGVDEPFQSGMGAFQRGVGAGAGHGYRVAAAESG